MTERDVTWTDLCDAINTAMDRHPDNIVQMYGWLSEKNCRMFSHLPARHYGDCIDFLNGLVGMRGGR